jgi:hypothetical protein
MRVNSANVLDEGLWIGRKATTRDSGSKIGTRRTQVHIPAVEDRYVLLAILYIITMVFTGSRCKRSCVSNLCLIYLVCYVLMRLSSRMSL